METECTNLSRKKIIIKQEDEDMDESNSSTPPRVLPDFITALNMQPVCKDRNSAKRIIVDGEESVLKFDMDVLDGEGAGEQAVSLGPGSKDVLIEKFKRDPDGVLKLLQSALSMEKLSTLLKEEHLRDTQLLPQLQNRLEAAYHTLRECQENKMSLADNISETNLRIGSKRKHLEELRGELKILGDEELKLKKQRDTSHTNHSELKKRLQCSTDALQQIALVTKATPASSNGDSGGRVNIGHGGGGKVAEHVTDTTTKVT